MNPNPRRLLNVIEGDGVTEESLRDPVVYVVENALSQHIVAHVRREDICATCGVEVVNRALLCMTSRSEGRPDRRHPQSC